MGKRKTDAAIPVLFRKLGMRGTTSIPFHYWNAARGMADLNGEEAAVQEGWDFLGRLPEMGRVYE